MDWYIAVGLCLAFLALGLLGGRWVQAKIDAAAIEEQRTKRKELQAENISLKKQLARVFVTSCGEIDKVKADAQREREVFLIAFEDIKKELLATKLSRDVWKKGVKSNAAVCEEHECVE